MRSRSLSMAVSNGGVLADILVEDGDAAACRLVPSSERYPESSDAQIRTVLSSMTGDCVDESDVFVCFCGAKQRTRIPSFPTAQTTTRPFGHVQARSSAKPR